MYFQRPRQSPVAMKLGPHISKYSFTGFSTGYNLETCMVQLSRYKSRRHQDYSKSAEGSSAILKRCKKSQSSWSRREILKGIIGVTAFCALSNDGIRYNSIRVVCGRCGRKTWLRENGTVVKGFLRQPSVPVCLSMLNAVGMRDSFLLLSLFFRNVLYSQLI